jgi:hypothetical protein
VLGVFPAHPYRRLAGTPGAHGGPSNA